MLSYCMHRWPCAGWFGVFKVCVRMFHEMGALWVLLFFCWDDGCSNLAWTFMGLCSTQYSIDGISSMDASALSAVSCVVWQLYSVLEQLCMHIHMCNPFTAALHIIQNMNSSGHGLQQQSLT